MLIKQIEVYDKLISQGKTEISLEANESFTKPKIKSPKSSISERVPSSSSRGADNQESKVGMDRILGRIQLFCIFGYISYQASRISGNARYHKENFLFCYSFLNSLCNHKFINLDIFVLSDI